MITTLFKAFTMLGSEWVMWLLILLSIFSIAIVIDRWKALRVQEKLGAKLWDEHIRNWMMDGDTNTVSKMSLQEIEEKYPCVEGRLLQVMKKSEKETESQLKLSVSSFLGLEKLSLEKNLAFLGTIGNNAPFIGLFGTVLGIIQAFHDLGAQVESAGAQTISAGLSEALVATAIGLLVAIPAAAFFNLYQRKIKSIMGRAQSLGDFMVRIQSR